MNAGFDRLKTKIGPFIKQMSAQAENLDTISQQRTEHTIFKLEYYNLQQTKLNNCLIIGSC